MRGYRKPPKGSALAFVAFRAGRVDIADMTNAEIHEWAQEAMKAMLSRQFRNIALNSGRTSGALDLGQMREDREHRQDAGVGRRALPNLD